MAIPCPQSWARQSCATASAGDFEEIYRLNSDKLKTNVDIVIVARSRCVEAEYSKMENAFLHACAELDILRGDEQ